MLTTIPELSKKLEETAAQLKLFNRSPLDLQSAFTRIELSLDALMCRIGMLELKVAALEEENKKLRAFG